ncbi:hypothetical protein [Aureibacter tunicatorum]|uniref:Uncharacterized protein n=1 Tax=Aureibacter tunicatorum TaxID=866807 RepID=A0AAE3XTN8_9BACT|nr:hypothetical protein [Aureibacter tunicatorum]MDR6241815.1 hypothetical protein [Aureibacter tunicatorum]BDD07062.1 hypothetical protein AUTU_45450 [Aureibacter tunicatorum]
MEFKENMKKIFNYSFLIGVSVIGLFFLNKGCNEGRLLKKNPKYSIGETYSVNNETGKSNGGFKAFCSGLKIR